MAYRVRCRVTCILACSYRLRVQRTPVVSGAVSRDSMDGALQRSVSVRALAGCACTRALTTVALLLPALNVYA